MVGSESVVLEDIAPGLEEEEEGCPLLDEDVFEADTDVVINGVT